MKHNENEKSYLDNFLSRYKDDLKSGLDSITIDSLEEIANILESSITSGSTIFTCGNGGSSAIAEHFVCDFLKGTSMDTSIQPVIHSLTSNTPTITAIANDIDYSEIFSYQIKKYGNVGDILLSISSSGNSPNIIEAIKEAKLANIKTISFVGFDGGKAKEISDQCIHIPIKNYGVVEDIHHSLMHILAQFIRLRNLNNKEDIENIVF